MTGRALTMAAKTLAPKTATPPVEPPVIDLLEVLTARQAAAEARRLAARALIDRCRAERREHARLLDVEHRRREREAERRRVASSVKG
jgi:hypothetical protein